MIKGAITKIFVQKDNDWGIYSIEDIYGRKEKAVGVIPGASVGMSVTLEGKPKNTRWGSEYVITSVLLAESDEFAAIRRFLSDGYVYGSKETMANAIISFFGADTEKVLLSDKAETELCRVKGIGPKKAGAMVESLPKSIKYLPILKVTKGSVTKTQAEMIYNKYGSGAANVLKKNPYRLIIDIKGFGFQKADSIAAGAGIKKNSIKRIEAGITYTIDTAASADGDCYLYKEDIRDRINTLLTKIPRLAQSEITNTIAENALKDWSTEGREKFIKAHKPTAETLDTLDDVYTQRQSILKSLDEAMEGSIRRGDLIDDNGRIFTKDMYERENYIANHICQMLDEGPVRRVTKKQIELSVRHIEDEKTKELNLQGINDRFEITDEQKEAVKRSLSKRISVITGGPGRGKTTIIEVIVDAFLNSGNRSKECVLMFAPTGRAAQRIHEQTGFEASTIHRGIFEYQNGRQVLKDSPKKKLIIVDESSMIDIYLMRSLIQFASDSQIIFVGDVDQIASVGPGKVLKDLIRSEQIPVSFLVKGHRNTGSIAENAMLINQGREIASYRYDSHFVYIPTDTVHIQQTVVNDYVRKVNEYGIKDVLLCVAMRERGPVCVNVMNSVLQDIFTKGHREVRIGERIFREGDRVMQTKNNYKFMIKRQSGMENGVFNGEKGTIAKITFKDGDPAIVVLFDDGSVGGYMKNTAADLTLAYATTVHKCQGSESPCVMMAYTFGDFMLLKRSLFYTGETRAKKEFRFYGEEQWKYGRNLSAFDMAVKKVDDKERNTMLAERIKTAAKGISILTA